MHLITTFSNTSIYLYICESGNVFFNTNLFGMLPFSVTASHHMLNPTLTIVLAIKMTKTTKTLISRFRKA